MDTQLNIDDLFKLSDLYFNEKNTYGHSPLYAHLHNAYNQCLDEDIPRFLEYGTHIIQEKVTDTNKIYRYTFLFRNITIKSPMLDSDTDFMFPMDARNRNLNYAAKMYAEVSQEQEIIDLNLNTTTKKIVAGPEKTVIALLPMMVKSKYCNATLYDSLESPFDSGGYFIVNGSERVVISTERKCENKPLVSLKKEIGFDVYSVQMNSKSYEAYGMIQNVTIKLKKNKVLNIVAMKIAHISSMSILSEVSVFILLKALGLQSDYDILNAILFDQKDDEMSNYIKILLETSKIKNRIYTQEDALQFLTTKLKIIQKYDEANKEVKTIQKRLYINEVLENHFLPHCNGTKLHKAYFLCYMIYRLLNCILGRVPPDDRDSFTNKRIDTVGTFIEDLFRQFFKNMLNDCNRFFVKHHLDDDHPINVINQIKPNTIFNGIKTKLLIGLWGKKKGVAQILPRLTYLHPQTFLRRIDSPNIDTQTNRSMNPRHYHTSQNGFICSLETIEHVKVGLVKNLTLIASITTMKYNQIHIIKNRLKGKIIDIVEANSEQYHKLCKIFLNGEWLGLIENQKEVYDELKKDKLTGIIDRQTGIVNDLDVHEIRIYCDGGRLFRPIIRVVNNEIQLTKKDIDELSKSKRKIKDSVGITWNHFITNNEQCIEYIDMEESSYMLIATSVKEVNEMATRMNESMKLEPTKDGIILNRYDQQQYKYYTHCEIHPSLLMGIMVTNIPFSNHTQAPRNIFQFSQGKQAMSIYLSNYRHRMDLCYILRHPHKALVNTRTSKYTYSNLLPCGENIIVAIAVYNGHNQDDSIIVNKSAVERGLFAATSYKKYMSEIKKNQITSQDDIFMKPDPEKVTGIRFGTYDKLNEKGYVPEETKVNNSDIIIGKVSHILPSENSDKIYKDISESYRTQEPGTIDRVQSDIYNSEGYGIIKIKVRTERVVRTGDKMCLNTSITDVLTMCGWKNIETITKNDLVATLDENHILKYEHPLDVMHFEYDGQMYKLRTQHVDLDVTIDHKLYVKIDKKQFECITAREAYGKRVMHKKNCINNYPDVEYFEHNEMRYNMDVFLKLVGIFITDGCIQQDKIYITYGKERKIKHLIDICTKLHLNLKLSKSKNYMHLNTLGYGKGHYINDKNLTDYFTQLNVGARNRFLPEFVWTLSQRHARILLNSLIEGNGSHNVQGSICYTLSRKLADDIMRLSIHAGWSGTIKTLRKKGTSNSINADALSIRINKTKNEPINTQHEQSEEIYQYKGQVSCLEVPSHVFMIRQNNKNVWIGNCCYTQDHDILTDKGWIRFSDLTTGYKVATLVDGYELKYEYPLAIQKYKYDSSEDGPIYEINTEQVELAVTQNHRMYIKEHKTYEIKEARYILNKTVTYKKAVDVYNPVQTDVQIPFDDIDIDVNMWLDFFGIIISCAFIIDTQVKFITNKIDGEELIKYYCKKFKIEIKNEMESCYTVINDNKLLDYIKSIQETIPEFCFKLSSLQCNVVLTGMSMGTYNIKDDYSNTFRTTVKTYADIFEIMSFHCNNVTIDYKITTHHNACIYNICTSSLKQYATVSVNNIKYRDKLIEYKGNIYCCTVPSGIIYVRRNGKPIWCGQSRMGQKGVVGILLPQSDMPFTKDGIIPDIIINPNAFPGRMTIGQMIECIVGKVAILQHYGEADGTPFNDISLDTIMNELENEGYPRDGTEELYNGMTGYKLKSKIFIGPTFYQRLRRFAFDNVHSRSRGSKTILTRQPPEGKIRNGGCRIGEMERDALLAHGCGNFMKEKFVDTSDAFCIQICDQCGLFAERMIRKDSKYYPTEDDIFWCRSCNNKSSISKIIVPYAFKLMLQELMSMNIAPRIKTNNIIE